LMVTHSSEHGARADRVIEMLDGEVIHGPNPVFPVAKNADISLAETNG